jgi:FkbM family methyltransferase
MDFEFKLRDRAVNVPIALLKLKVEGLRHPVGLRPDTSDMGAFAQVFLERDYQLTLAKPPRLIVDAGANIGLVSALFASQFPEAKIIAIEPLAENVQLLVENMRPYPNVQPVHAAIWNKSGTVNLVTHDQDEKFLGHWGIRVSEGLTASGSPPVRAMTILEVLVNSGFPVIDILKIDIEGAELDIFNKDARLWLARTNVLIIELHDRFRPGCKAAVHDAMRSFGFMAFKRAENTFFVRNKPL